MTYNASVTKLILAFVTLLIGAVLIGSVASEGLGKTVKDQALIEAIDIASVRSANETGSMNQSVNLTVAYPPTYWEETGCALTGFSLHNGSTEFTADTDYVISARDGRLTMLDTGVSRDSLVNTTYVNYTYCQDGYMNLSWGRTGINLVPGFFAIAMLLISVALFFSVAKDNQWF